MWSTQEPVTVFGAERTVIGSEEACQAFRWLATRFSNLTDYRFELVAAGASGDLAYTVGYEHVVFSIDGGPVAPLTLQVTHLYRREDGEWKIVHRHADAPNRSAPFRRCIDGVGVPARGQGHAGATLGHIPTERQGQQRSRVVGQRPSSAALRSASQILGPPGSL
jgi:ketosteroid isomerase-like protein